MGNLSSFEQGENGVEVEGRMSFQIFLNGKYGVHCFRLGFQITQELHVAEPLSVV